MGKMVDCPKCEGTGSIEEDYTVDYGLRDGQVGVCLGVVVCPHCGGKGYV